MDLYFRVNQGVTFSVSGPSEVHLCGYWEPTEDLLGEGGDPYGAAEFDEEDSEDEIDEEELQALRKAKQNTKKNENIPIDDSDDDDSDEELKQTAKKIQ